MNLEKVESYLMLTLMLSATLLIVVAVLAFVVTLAGFLIGACS